MRIDAHQHFWHYSAARATWITDAMAVLKRDYKPYLDVVFEAFGPERLMFGSDWPVCLLSLTYSFSSGTLVQRSARS